MEERGLSVLEKKMQGEMELSLERANDVSEKFGLRIGKEQMEILISRQRQSLRETGRVDFGGGILPRLIYAFCDSPYVDSINYLETLCALQDIFYYFKNDSGDLLPDDDLIATMRRCFDEECGGSVEYLQGTILEALSRAMRYGYQSDVFEEDREEEI